MTLTTPLDIDFNITSSDLFEAAIIRGNPDRPFLYFEEEFWSYEKTQQMSWGYAAQLLDAGIGVGDRVLAITPNDPRTVAIHFALSWVGAAYAPIIPKSSADEISFMTSNTQPRAVVLDKTLVGTLRPLFEDHGVPIIVLDENAITKPPGDRAEIDPSAEFSIMYTSGSTGRPKGVVLPHCGVVAAGYMWGTRMGLNETDVVLGVNPQFHVGGMKNVHIAMACGGAYMMQQQFSRTRFWKDVQLSGATAGVLMPAMCSILLTEPPRPDDRDNSIRRIVSHFVNREFEERFDIDILTVWGMSETSGTATMTTPGYPEKLPNLAGWPTHQLIEVVVRDDNGKDLPVGITGEIWARHPWQFTGYLNDPVGTAETIVDGWIRSGDLGHLDDQGRLFYEGRKKNMIKRAGENVSGLEVEQCLASHPDVSEAGVFGVPDPIRTEEVKAVLVLRPGATVTLPELVQWCEERLSPFKVPRYWEVRSEMPRAAVHKVSLPQLRKEHDPSNPGWDRTVD